MTDRDFSAVTELPGEPATSEQVARLRQRYLWAVQQVPGKRVLEAACGAGQGLGLLAHAAARVVGGDYTLSLVARARSHYGTRVPLLCLDAQQLPFVSGSFDVIVLFEAIYYLQDAARFLQECRRVLASGGRVLLSSVNSEWKEFSPSDLATRHYSTSEISDLLRESGFKSVELFGGFRIRARSSRQRIVSVIRRVAVSLHLVPKTLAGRQVLKRIFYGRLEPLGPELPKAAAPVEEVMPLASDPHEPDFKIVYAAAARGDGPPERAC